MNVVNAHNRLESSVFYGKSPDEALQIVLNASEECLQKEAPFLKPVQVEYIRDLMAAGPKKNTLLNIWRKAHPSSAL
jgi:hypothetical protein